MKSTLEYKKITPNYTLYEDGRVWSHFFQGRFLKPTQYNSTSKNGVPHFAYTLQIEGKRKVVQLSRLLMFYYGHHPYKTIKSMPTVMFIDGNTKNWKLSNLRFAKRGDICRKANKALIKSDINSKIKDTELPKIKNYLEENYPLGQIASLYNCSDMSVVRFKKRNNL